MQPEHLCKIKNICDALVAAGFDTLDKQAEVLGLPRSTTWTILHGTHKKSGLSATLLTRMLKSLRLPPAVRAKIIEYIEAKAAGGLGHNKLQQRRFVARLKREPNREIPLGLRAATEPGRSNPQGGHTVCTGPHFSGTSIEAPARVCPGQGSRARSARARSPQSCL
jgi:hypothetical protein